MSVSFDERAVFAPSSGVTDALAAALAEAPPNVTSVFALPAPVSPSEALLARKERDAVAWAAPSGFEVAALGSAHTLEGRGSTRFSSVAAAGRALLGGVRTVGLLGAPAAPPRLFGGFSFHAGPPRSELWQSFGEARFVLPELCYLVDGGSARLLVTLAAARSDRSAARDELVELATGALRALERGMDVPGEVRRRSLEERPDAEWGKLVEQIRAEIARGALEKAVLARRVQVTLDGEPDPADVLYRLRRQAPECTRFLFRQSGKTFLGATPEWLARKRGGTLETEAVAGSIGALEPNARARLLGSDKDRAEHALVVREILRALEPVAASVEHAAEPEICALRHVLHLRTRVTAVLREAPHLLELVERLHPTPAVGGIPTARALEWLSAHEPDERGWYAGPVGWFDAAGDGEMAVALRSGVLEHKTAHLYVGSGIVQGSAPAAELTETRWKLRTLLGALGVAE
jgi:menaquinone-specific isochorismate synthase